MTYTVRASRYTTHTFVPSASPAASGEAAPGTAAETATTATTATSEAAAATGGSGGAGGVTAEGGGKDKETELAALQAVVAAADDVVAKIDQVYGIYILVATFFG